MLVLNPKTGLKYGVVCNGLSDYYREIGCDCIDITSRIIGGKPFDIICDDEGLLKDNPVEMLSMVYIYDDKFMPGLVGTLIFASHDTEGNTLDLSVEDELMIASHVRLVCIKAGEKTITANYCVILDVDEGR